MGAAVAGIPFASALVDRHPRQRVLLGIHLTRAAALGLAAVVLVADINPWLVLIFAAMSTFSGAPYRPALLRDHADPRSLAPELELDGEVFVSAVSGHDQTYANVEEVVAGRLDELERLPSGKRARLRRR